MARAANDGSVIETQKVLLGRNGSIAHNPREDSTGSVITGNYKRHEL